MKTVISLACAFPFTLWKSYAISLLLRWFVYPYCEIQELSIIHICGLLGLVEIIKGIKLPLDSSLSEKEKDEQFVNSMFVGLFLPPISIGIGYLWKCFI